MTTKKPRKGTFLRSRGAEDKDTLRFFQDKKGNIIVVEKDSRAAFNVLRTVNIDTFKVKVETIPSFERGITNEEIIKRGKKLLK